MAFSGYDPEPQRRYPCGCLKLMMAYPVNCYVRTWTSRCTVPEHQPKSKTA